MFRLGPKGRIRRRDSGLSLKFRRNLESARNMARGKKIPSLHPGEVLYEDFVVPTGISIHRLAMDLRVPANRIAEIVKGKRAISADTALRLSRYLGTSAEFWLGLQTDYELEKAKDHLGARIAREVHPRK